MCDWEIVIVHCDVSCFGWMNGNACLNRINRREREEERRKKINRELGGESTSLVYVCESSNKDLCLFTLGAVGKIKKTCVTM